VGACGSWRVFTHHSTELLILMHSSVLSPLRLTVCLGCALLSFSAHVNFQAPGSATPSGYTADIGAAYGARNGLTYLGGQFCDLDPVDCEDDDCDSCVHTLRLLPERSPRVVRLTQTTANQVQLQLRCLPEQSCVLEVSPDLLQWTPLSTNLAAGEIMDCFDGAASGWPQRFYRVRVLP